jgi:HEAT repeat protein
MSEMKDDESVDPAASEKELDAVKDILRTLTKTQKTFAVYPKDNPIYRTFAAELFDKLNLFFASSDELSLDVQRYSLLFKGTEVFRSEERTDNMALLLFADGIRQISCRKGLSMDEITDFIDILRFAPKSQTSDDDDIVTLLWEKNIKNMGYAAVEDTIDDNFAIEESLLQDEAAAGVATEEATDAGTNHGEVVEGPADASSHEKAPGPEIESLKDEFARFNEQSLLTAAVGLFFDLLNYEDTTDTFRELVNNLGRILAMSMQQGDLQTPIRIMNGLKHFSSIYTAPDQVALIDSVLEKAATVNNLTLLFQIAPGPEIIRQYLHLLGKNALAPSIHILGELLERKQRRLLCEILAELGRQEIGILAESLDDPRWYVVRNIVMIMGMTKEPAIITHVSKAMKHSDPRVRKEVLRAIETFKTDETKKIVLAAVRDQDPSVRINALMSSRRFRDPGLFHELKGYASFEELRKKPFEEKMELLRTLALVGGTAAFPLLSDLFRRRGLIEKNDVTEVRVAAAYGLGLTGLPEAAELLEKGTGARNRSLRDACMDAIRESQKSGIAGK